MELTTIRELFKNREEYLDKQVTVGGWIRSIRDSKTFGFIVLNDGSYFETLQVVYHDKMENFAEISKLNVGAAVIVTGTLVATPQAKQPFEIQADTVEVEGASAPDYPLQKKRHSFEYLRTIAHLRPRTNTFQAVFRVRSLTAYAIHKFFQERGFVYVHTPLITGSDCEGAGEMFQVTTMDLNNVPKNEDGSVDYESLMRLVEYQVQNGTDFLCVLGTTAETPTLTTEEKKKIKETVVERVNGRIPILLGISSNCTQTVVDTLKNDDFTGVDAVLVAVPYYNKPSQEGIYQHYKAIAKATDLPVVLYNVPGRTGVNMTAETTLRLARDFDNIVAIKEASGNITQMDDIIKNKPENFDVISGDDGITFPLITLGAVGVISVIGNAFPREFSRMTRLALAGDYASALTIHHKFTELFKLLFVDGNPAGVKAMLNMMGMIKNRLRLPLVPTRITTYEEMRKILDELKIKY